MMPPLPTDGRHVPQLHLECCCKRWSGVFDTIEDAEIAWDAHVDSGQHEHEISRLLDLASRQRASLGEPPLRRAPRRGWASDPPYLYVTCSCGTLPYGHPYHTITAPSVLLLWWCEHVGKCEHSARIAERAGRAWKARQRSAGVHTGSGVSAFVRHFARDHGRMPSPSELGEAYSDWFADTLEGEPR